MSPVVVILTTCRRMDLLYGSTLVFRTLRVGFPTAQVVVIDNASIADARPVIAKAAHDVGAIFIQHEVRELHAAIINQALWNSVSPVVFVDTDVIFWKPCEDWKVDGLLAGRWIPEFYLHFMRAMTPPRIHPSFAWLPDPAALRQEIQKISDCNLGFAPFAQVSLRTGEGWRFWDTMAGISTAISEIQRFSEPQLDCYDHLFCGTIVDLVLPPMPDPWRAKWAEIHWAAANGDIDSVRGCWKMQEEFFQSSSDGAI